MSREQHRNGREHRQQVLDTLKATGELLPGCVTVGEREHFAVRFGHARMTGKDAGTGDAGKEEASAS